MNSKILLYLFVFTVLLALAGCNGQHCITVGGEYQGVSGNVEYCFDAKKSEALDVPVFDEAGENGNKELFGFDLDQINEIKDLLKEKIGLVSASSADKSSEAHPVTEILNLLGREGKANGK